VSVCDSFKNWYDPGRGGSDRFQDVSDWIRGEAASWGVDNPNVVEGKSVDADGNEHWSSYDRQTNTITLDPDLFTNPDAHDPADVFNAGAHELEHAMQDQYYGDRTDAPSDAERQQDAKDFADAYSDEWDDECDTPQDSESSPGNDTGDWNLPPSDGGAYA
jgi:hypothetical protein